MERGFQEGNSMKSVSDYVLTGQFTTDLLAENIVNTFESEHREWVLSCPSLCLPSLDPHASGHT